jgi:XTP/dITP diphosphohydrolase
MLTQETQKTIKLVIASKNLHKIREMRAMLSDVKQLDIWSLLDFPEYESISETGKTFEENAIQKAVHAATKLRAWTLGEDSGLVVPALQGAPGIYSRRYAGEKATDKDNRKKLLSEMSHLLDDERSAYYSCTIALATPDGTIKKITTATCEGLIENEEKGGNGFGYDPVFLKHEYSKTFGELEESIKNRVSHRRKAIDKILPTIESIRE